MHNLMYCVIAKGSRKKEKKNTYTKVKLTACVHYQNFRVRVSKTEKLQ